MQTLYMKISGFNEIFTRLKQERESFELRSTNYTKQIKFTNKDVKYIFNEDAVEDYKGLALINKVRKDATEFLKPKMKLHEPKFINFYNLIDRPPEGIIAKVDLTSAYWSYSMKEGIISSMTDRFFEQSWDKETTKKKKQARLKALGSLATKKEFRIFVDGILKDQWTEMDIQKRNLYMSVCKGVDNIMNDTINNVDGIFFYYWDCFFCNEENVTDVIEYLKTLGYGAKVGVTKIIIEEQWGRKYIRATSDNKIYMTRNEKRFLLDDLYNTDSKNSINDNQPCYADPIIPDFSSIRW